MGQIEGFKKKKLHRVHGCASYYSRTPVAGWKSRPAAGHRTMLIISKWRLKLDCEVLEKKCTHIHFGPSLNHWAKDFDEIALIYFSSKVIDCHSGSGLGPPERFQAVQCWQFTLINLARTVEMLSKLVLDFLTLLHYPLVAVVVLQSLRAPVLMENSVGYTILIWTAC